MLEELEVTHERHLLLLKLSELLTNDLSIAFAGLWQSKREKGANLKFEIIHLFVTLVLFTFDPLLQLWNVIEVQVGLVRELLESVHIFDCQFDVWLPDETFEIDDHVIISCLDCVNTFDILLDIVVFFVAILVIDGFSVGCSETLSIGLGCLDGQCTETICCAVNLGLDLKLAESHLIVGGCHLCFVLMI